MQLGDVFKFKVAFDDDPSQYKKRPVMVVSEDADKIYLLVTITSEERDKYYKVMTATKTQYLTGEGRDLINLRGVEGKI